MIDVVLDTNVLASGVAGFPNPDSTTGELLRRWRARAFVLVVSEHILAELDRTFANRYFTSRLSDEQITAAMETLRSSAVIQTVTVRVAGIATQPKDDLVLATALSAGVDYVITGDKPLQALSRYLSLTILSPRQFLDLLEAQAH